MHPSRYHVAFRVKARMLANASPTALEAYDELAPALSGCTSWGDIAVLVDRYAERTLSRDELLSCWDGKEPETPYVTLIDGIRARVIEQRKAGVAPVVAALKALTNALARDPSEFNGA